jgi:hypothetical protein
VIPMQHFQPPNVPYQQGHYRPPMYEHPTKYSVAPHKPTAADFEQLKKIDADYKSKTNSAPMSKTIEGNEKTTITITKHVCATCGRIRSWKYHHEHPIKPGETPTSGFCRKCQRDASSTDGSGSNRKPPSVSNKKKQAKVTTRSRFTSFTLLISARISRMTRRRAKPKVCLLKSLL